MSRGTERVKWAWEHKKVAIPLASVLLLTAYCGTGDLVDHAGHGPAASETNAPSNNNAEANVPAANVAPAQQAGGLVCRTVVEIKDGHHVLRVTHNRPLPADSALAYVTRYANKPTKDIPGGGDRGADSAMLHDNRGDVLYAQANVVPDGGTPIPCFEWNAPHNAADSVIALHQQTAVQLS